ncbi:hypothetical protein fugu_018556, partial [Takifugu bimaculatus]
MDQNSELFESVRETVGRTVKLTLRRKVQLEVKGDKVESRVLLEHSFSYLDIQGISSNKPTQLVLQYDRGLWNLHLGSTEEVDEVIAHIGSCLRRISPQGSPVKLMKKLSLKPPDRTAALQALWEEQGPADLGPCGGFSHQYRDLVAITTALEYNQWFTKVSSKDYKLSTDVCEQILRVVARSSRLEELVLENAGLKRCKPSLSQALCSNPAVATNAQTSGLSLQSFLSHSNCLESLDPVQQRLLSGAGSVKRSRRPFKTVLQQCPRSDHSQPVRNQTVPGGSELRSGGSQILEGCIAEIPNITFLDISDNGLDMDLTTLLVWLAKNRSIKHLSLGKNFNNIKSKNVAQVLGSLVHMIQEEDSPLSSLSLADSKLKGDLSILLNALGSNTSLTKLDISGNAMGDMGAKMLAKALQINTKLRTVVWDRNNVSPQGLQDVAAALEKNFTIRFMPVPIMDAAQALKTNPEKTEDALLKMEQYLLRNHETRKYLQEQAYRLQQGIVMTTTQQMMDMMCVRVQDHLNSLRFSETSLVQEDVKVAKNLMTDAKSSKT